MICPINGSFSFNCNRAITIATNVDPYNIEVVRALRSALETEGIQGVNDYLDRNCMEESVRDTLKDAAVFIYKSESIDDIAMARTLENQFNHLERTVQELFDLRVRPYRFN